MRDDPIVEEVRRIRDAYAKQFDYDLDAIFDDLMRSQEARSRNMVAFSARRIPPERARRRGAC